MEDAVLSQGELQNSVQALRFRKSCQNAAIAARPSAIGVVDVKNSQEGPIDSRPVSIFSPTGSFEHIDVRVDICVDFADVR